MKVKMKGSLIVFTPESGLDYYKLGIISQRIGSYETTMAPASISDSKFTVKELRIDTTVLLNYLVRHEG